ncbi:crotonobetainyl-CoA:carnitine CoA-transferase CaiB-like acyl-CoA transferase [Humitalea rosea]|uniref:Crotonobetainyl-CoA:carnitine CoA-transferase CaiB-like acyl-CoA transferase n=1 Tax=Humitalea rosea TaxID=990373 RepID=A0A2W7HXR6_9PROT|nr:CoA transferase [Humitalea rosea]PZW39274.1 crotonobetainyl-CoA:carnitine CoA-transferase CaiB-like acyl-CoA transferase [Humitalea rosea]
MPPLEETGLPRADYTPGVRGPLEGVRVLDLSRLVAGNTVTQHLADFGAIVDKVEPRDGDTLRGWRVKGVETAWKVHGRGKRSLCIDFRHKEAVPLIRRLVPGAAILVESFRPGTMEAMGLSPEVLLELEPRLIILRISGWGQDGPYSRRPGFGTLIEGFAGFADMNGFPDREPVLPPMYLADTIAGLTGAFAAMAALREVEVNGGQGQVIDLPLLDPLFTALGPQAANYRLTGRVKQRTGSRSTGAAPRNVYRTSDDGWVCLSASTQGMAERVMRSIGRGDLVDDPRFRTNEARVANGEMLDGIIGAFVGTRTLEENVAFFEAAEVTIGPVNNIVRFMHDRHVQARALVADYPDADMGSFPMHAVSSRLSGTPGAIRSPAPRLGEHSRQILAGQGFDTAEIEAAVTSGLVAAA